MAGVLFVYEGAVARPCRRRTSTKGRLPAAAAAGRRHACSCAACSTAAAAAAAAAAAVRARGGLLCGWCACVKFGSVLVQVPNRWWLHRFVYSSRDSEVARAHVTFLPFSTGTHVIWAGCFCVVVLRQAGQIE